jgi:hypothetical protein
MPQAGAVSYIAYKSSTKGSRTYKPESRAPPFTKDPEDKVPFLWGDMVYVRSIQNSICEVSAKGHILNIPESDLMDKGILRLYQIDCGQGDSAIIEFPDDRWMVIDGGPPREGDYTNTGKIAFDFMKWKIFVDYSWRREITGGPKPFAIDSLVVTHPDFDHFGGFLELPKKVLANSAFERITVDTIYHNGLGRFSGPFTKYENGRGHSQLGPVRGNALPDAYLTDMIDGFNDVRNRLAPTADRSWQLSGRYRSWLEDILPLEGHGIGEMKRLHSKLNDGFVPGHEPTNGDSVSVRILGPVEESWNGEPALRYIDTAGKSSMSDPSRTRNGLSVTLRIDYRKVRILMTGDLNFKSQAVLLKHTQPDELCSHVVKACHHGSEDVSWKFLQAMNPFVVLFSSGDNETYEHPKAKVLGWSGAFSGKVKGRTKKFLGLEEENFRSPLIYSTELARSSRLWDIYSVLDSNGKAVRKPQIKARGRSKSKAGEGPVAEKNKWLLADRLIYGLVNVRTDGERIVIAIMNEGKTAFQCQSITVKD